MAPENVLIKSERIDTYDYIQVILKRSKLILYSMVATAVIVAVLTLFMPNKYTAKAVILPISENKDLTKMLGAQLGGMAGAASELVGGPTVADLYATILKSEALKDVVINRFNLLKLYDEKYRAVVYRILDKNMKVTVGRKDGVITVEFTNDDPKLATDITNAFVGELGKLAAEINMRDAGLNRAFVEKKLVEAKADLQKKEEILKQFQQKNKLVSVPDQLKATLERIAAMKASLAFNEVQLATNRRIFTDNSSEIKNYKLTIVNLKSQIARLEEDSNMGALPGLGAGPELSKQYLDLYREVKSKEVLVEMLQKQYEMVSLTEAKDVAPFKLIQEARQPDRKSAPKRAVIVFVLTFVMLFLSTAAAFILESYEKLPDGKRETFRMYYEQSEPRKVAESIVNKFNRLRARWKGNTK